MYETLIKLRFAKINPREKFTCSLSAKVNPREMLKEWFAKEIHEKVFLLKVVKPMWNFSKINVDIFIELRNFYYSVLRRSFLGTPSNSIAI